MDFWVPDLYAHVLSSVHMKCRYYFCTAKYYTCRYNQVLANQVVIKKQIVFCAGTARALTVGEQLCSQHFLRRDSPCAKDSLCRDSTCAKYYFAQVLSLRKIIFKIVSAGASTVGAKILQCFNPGYRRAAAKKRTPPPRGGC